MSLQHDQLLSNSLNTTSGTLIEEQKCKRHGNEDNRFICLSCTCFVCSDCFLDKHRKHKIKRIRKVASEYKRKARTILTDMVETLKSLSKLKDSLLRERENHLISAAKFKEKTKICTSKVVRIVQNVSEEYMTEATEFQDEQEESYQRELSNIKDFEEIQYALHTELKNVTEEENDMSLVTSFFRLQKDIKKIGPIPCPEHVKIKSPFVSNLMVSEVVDILTSNCNMQNKEKEKEEMLEKTLQEKEDLIKSLNENMQRQQEEFKAILYEKNCEFEIIKSLNLQLVTQDDPLPIPTQERYTKNLITNLEFEKQLLQTRLDSKTEVIDQMKLRMDDIQQQREQVNSGINDGCYDILNKLDLLIEHKIKVEEERNVLQQENERLNSAIAALSDPNRPEKLSEKFREMYDSTWSDLLDVITEKTGGSDETCVKHIFSTLMIIYDTCKNTITKNRRKIAKLVGYQADCVDQTYACGPFFKSLKDLLQVSVTSQTEDLKEKIKLLPEIEIIIKYGGKSGDGLITEFLQLCLYMCTQDPPVVLDFSCKSGDVFNKDKFIPFTKSGDIVDYVVWPVMYLNTNGVIMSKGIAQGKKISQSDNISDIGSKLDT